MSDSAATAARHFFLTWLDISERHTALQRLDELSDPTLGSLAMKLTEAAHDDDGCNMERLAVLALIVVLLNTHAISHHVNPDDSGAVTNAAHDAVNDTVRGVFADRQKAAFAAVRQLGTATALGLSADVEAELGSAAAASKGTLDLVEQRIAERHGWLIREHQALGWLLIKSARD
jgi:hypothetical protein